jgi:hypothetical protein
MKILVVDVGAAAAFTCAGATSAPCHPTNAVSTPIRVEGSAWMSDDRRPASRNRSAAAFFSTAPLLLTASPSMLAVRTAEN